MPRQNDILHATSCLPLTPPQTPCIPKHAQHPKALQRVPCPPETREIVQTSTPCLPRVACWRTSARNLLPPVRRCMGRNGTEAIPRLNMPPCPTARTVQPGLSNRCCVAGITPGVRRSCHRQDHPPACPAGVHEAECCAPNRVSGHHPTIPSGQNRTVMTIHRAWGGARGTSADTFGILRAPRLAAHLGDEVLDGDKQVGGRARDLGAVLLGGRRSSPGIRLVEVRPGSAHGTPHGRAQAPENLGHSRHGEFGTTAARQGSEMFSNQTPVCNSACLEFS